VYLSEYFSPLGRGRSGSPKAVTVEVRWQPAKLPPVYICGTQHKSSMQG
jgi:hypothetical protein